MRQSEWTLIFAVLIAGALAMGYASANRGAIAANPLAGATMLNEPTSQFPHSCEYRYNAKVVRWVDGDTIVLDVDLGFGIWVHKEHIRLARIDTPEMRGAEKIEGRKVKLAMETKIPVGTMIVIETAKDGKGKYGRYVAEIFYNGQNISDYLLANNMAEEVDY